MALSQWKEAILQGIFRDIEKGVVEEKHLERLENLVEILQKEGSKVPESVKEAYRQVAVECTARCLAYEKDPKEAYTEAMRSIWLRRIMPLCDKASCLVTHDLLNSCKRLWTAHNDEKACETLMDEDTREQALVSLRKVVSELQPNHDYANESDDRNEEMDKSEEGESSEESGETEPMVEAREVNSEAMDKHNQGPTLSELRLLSSLGESSEESGETEPMIEAREINNTKATDQDHQESPPDTELVRRRSDESKADSPPRNFKTISTAVFNRVLGDLRAAKEGQPSNSNNTTIAEQGNDVANPSGANIALRPSLMERKTTAEVYEWKDSIDDSDGEADKDGERNNKSKRQRIVVSPLNRNEKGGRRPKVPWCTAETLALLKGYEKYGANWKRIKEECPVLIRRTNGDLKDKFRVEMRRKERQPRIGTGVE